MATGSVMDEHMPASDKIRVQPIVNTIAVNLYERLISSKTTFVASFSPNGLPGHPAAFYFSSIHTGISSACKRRNVLSDYYWIQNRFHKECFSYSSQLSSAVSTADFLQLHLYSGVS